MRETKEILKKERKDKDRHTKVLRGERNQDTHEVVKGAERKGNIT